MNTRKRDTQKADARFDTKVLEVDGHWLWQDALNESGYGTLWIGDKLVKAHRYAYERFVGLIPEGFQVDHLCGNTTCVNPEHLEAVTPEENRMRRDYEGRTSAQRRIEALGKAARRLRYLDYAAVPAFLDEIAEFLTDIEAGRKLVVDTADLEGLGERVQWCAVHNRWPMYLHACDADDGCRLVEGRLLIPIPDPQPARNRLVVERSDALSRVLAVLDLDAWELGLNGAAKRQLTTEIVDALADPQPATEGT